jgi:glycosyltransferase involved in cell wall biosynthesis
MYFAKYLAEFGIEPVVLTVKENQASYSSLDETLNDEVRHVKTYKTSTLEPIRLYSFLKSGSSKKNIPQGNVGGKKPGIVDKLARHIRANYFIPDARVGWNPYAFKKAKTLLQSETFDWVITTGPPHSTHLIGLKLKKELNIKWLADFRDPWTEVYYNDIFKRTKKNEAKDKALEIEVLQKADHILTVGPSMKRLLETKIPNETGKISYLFNGYDQAKINQAPLISFPTFTLAYVGTLSSNYPYKTLIKALETSLKTTTKPIELILAGKIEVDVIDDFKKLESEVFKVTHRGIIPHQQALSIMKSADALLILLPIYNGSSIFVSGKLMEYIACKKPILGVLQKNSDADYLISTFSSGRTVEENEHELLASEINHISNGTKTECNTKSPDVFERRNTSKLLSDLLKKLEVK